MIARAIAGGLLLLLLPACAGADRDSTGLVPAADRTVSGADSGWILRRSAMLGGPREGPAALSRPSGLALDAFGRLYVTDAGTHRLQRYDVGGVWLGESGALGGDPGQLRRPAAVAAAGALAVAVLDAGNRRIVHYDLFGQFKGVLVDLASDAVESVAGRVDAVALAADRGGALYVADAAQDRILVFDHGGRFVRTLGRYGEGPGAFRGIAGLAVTRGGELLVSERDGARVQRLDASGRALASWPLDLGGARVDALPVAVDDSSRIAVADERGGRVWCFDPRGRSIAFASALGAPSALSFGGAQDLWIAESDSSRITRWRLEARAAPPDSGSR